MRALLLGLLVSQAAFADSLTINTADISLYYRGDGLVVDGNSVSMNVTAFAQGDHPGQMFVDSFEAEPWTWNLTINGQEVDGSGLCTATWVPTTMTLSCE